jgi:hypothetical protein
MLPIFIASGHIDDNWFYNYDTHGWHKIDQSDPFVDLDVVQPVPSEIETSLPAPAPVETSLRRRI